MKLVKMFCPRKTIIYKESGFFYVYSRGSIYGMCTAMKCIYFFLLQNVNEQYLGDVFFDASLMIWSIALAVVTQLGLCSAFICTLWVAFPLLTKLMIHKEFSQKGTDFQERKLVSQNLYPCSYLSKRNYKH